MALVLEVLLLMNIQRMDMFLTPTQHTNQMESKPTEQEEFNLWAETMCRTAAETKKIEQTNMTFPLIRKIKGSILYESWFNLFILSKFILKL